MNQPIDIVYIVLIKGKKWKFKDFLKMCVKPRMSTILKRREYDFN